jgi:hypothetical protein
MRGIGLFHDSAKASKLKTALLSLNQEIYYVKSFEEDFCTKHLINRQKATFQSVFDIINKNEIRPNTLSFGRKRRLSTTILHEKYLKTYRPQGIIFRTAEKPDYIFPFDLTVLAATKDIIVHYYRIKEKLNIYYNRPLLSDFEKFLFKDFAKMLKKYSSPKKAWIEVNKFRKMNGYDGLPRQKFRLFEYNEAVFHKPIKIVPVGVFGYRKEARRIAKKLNLPCFVSAKRFYESLSRYKLSPIFSDTALHRPNRSRRSAQPKRPYQMGSFKKTKARFPLQTNESI